MLYFPKQNLEKISSIISSLTTSPVIFDKSSKISLINIEIISNGNPFSNVSFVLFTSSIALETKSYCLTFVIMQ